MDFVEFCVKWKPGFEVFPITNQFPIKRAWSCFDWRVLTFRSLIPSCNTKDFMASLPFVHPDNIWKDLLFVTIVANRFPSEMHHFWRAGLWWLSANTYFMLYYDTTWQINLHLPQYRQGTEPNTLTTDQKFIVWINTLMWLCC